MLFPISQELQTDLIAYLAFLAGQLLFFLKRAGSAMRNPNTDIRSRREYFNKNWDTLGIRAAMEFPFFYGWRHYSFGQLASIFGWNIPTWFVIPENPITAFFLGYAADSLLDWISMSQKLPSFLRSWIQENVPRMEGVVQLQNTLDQAAEASREALAQSAKAADAVAVAKEQVPLITKPKEE